MKVMTLLWFFPERIIPNRAPLAGLKERGHECEDDGPSYLVHLYEEDPGFPKHLNGRFKVWSPIVRANGDALQ